MRRSILEEFQKETFWQRVGFKKVNKELPLYSLANDSLRSTRTNLQKIVEQSFVGQKQIYTRKKEIIVRHQKAIDLSETIREKKE